MLEALCEPLCCDLNGGGGGLARRKVEALFRNAGQSSHVGSSTESGGSHPEGATTAHFRSKEGVVTSIHDVRLTDNKWHKRRKQRKKSNTTCPPPPPFHLPSLAKLLLQALSLPRTTWSELHIKYFLVFS